jgi:hypothetical protein
MTLQNDSSLLENTEWNDAQQRELRELIAANRTRALWSLPADYYPTNAEGARLVLERIAARGDRATFVRARRLLQQTEKATA